MQPTSAPLSPTQLGLAQLPRHRMAMAGLVLLVLLSLYASFGGMLWAHGYCAPIKATLQRRSLGQLQ